MGQVLQTSLCGATLLLGTSCCKNMREGSLIQPSKTSFSARALQQKDQHEKRKAWDSQKIDPRKHCRARRRESEAGTCTAALGNFVCAIPENKKVGDSPSI